MKHLFSEIAARALWVTGISRIAFRRVAKNRRFVLEFHGVPAHPYPKLPVRARSTLWRKDLDSILSWLSRRLSFLTPDEFFSGDRPGVLLTFDDGFANNFDVVLPMIERYKAPAVFFVATGHVAGNREWLPFVKANAELYWNNRDAVPPAVARDLYDGMTEREIARCAENHLVTIGAHSVSHPRLSDVDDDRLRSEVSRSKQTLEEMTGKAVDLFAYPYGDARSREVLEVSKAGFKAAFVEQPLDIEDSIFAIPRLGIHRSDPWYMTAKLSGLDTRPVSGMMQSK